jgi:hypothetical protein
MVIPFGRAGRITSLIRPPEHGKPPFGPFAPANRPSQDGSVARYLVVGNKTLGGEHLLDKVRECIAAGPSSFYLVVPASPPGDHAWTEGEARTAARARLDEELERLRELGADVEGDVGDSNPMLAIEDVMRDNEFDQIILSTLPLGPSRWLKLDLPDRVRTKFGLPVIHVIGEPGE